MYPCLHQEFLNATGDCMGNSHENSTGRAVRSGLPAEVLRCGTKSNSLHLLL